MERRKVLYTIASAFGLTASLSIFKMDVNRPERTTSSSDPQVYGEGRPQLQVDADKNLEDYSIESASDHFSYEACEVEDSDWMDEFDL